MDSEITPKNRRFTSRDIFGIFVSLAMGLLALGAWRVFFDTILNPDVRNTVTALFWFSLLGAAFLLGAIVWREPFSQAISPVLVFVPSLLFVQTWHHFVLVLIAVMLSYLAIRFVQDEMEDRVRFRFFHNVKSGSFTFVLALSVALSSAYFSSIRSETWEELVPRFNVGEGTATVLIRTIAYMYPEWKNLADEGMTVDGFLLSLKKDETPATQDAGVTIDPATLPALAEYLRQNIPESGTLDQSELSQELYLRSGREQISKLVGKSIQGNEKIADVFSLAMQHKIITVLSGEQVSKHLSPSIVPLILALFLFLTLVPLGSVAAYFWMGLSFFFFRVGLFFGWLKLEQVPRNQERLLS